jgi:hypothetical protein
MQGPGTLEEQLARHGQQQAQRLIEDLVRVLVRLLEAALFMGASYLLYRVLHSLVQPSTSNEYHQVARHGQLSFSTPVTPARCLELTVSVHMTVLVKHGNLSVNTRPREAVGVFNTQYDRHTAATLQYVCCN